MQVHVNAHTGAIHVHGCPVHPMACRWEDHDAAFRAANAAIARVHLGAQLVQPDGPKEDPELFRRNAASALGTI